jgi:hypothetical protein
MMKMTNTLKCYSNTHLPNKIMITYCDDVPSSFTLEACVMLGARGNAERYNHIIHTLFKHIKSVREISGMYRPKEYFDIPVSEIVPFFHILNDMINEEPLTRPDTTDNEFNEWCETDHTNVEHPLRLRSIDTDNLLECINLLFESRKIRDGNNKGKEQILSIEGDMMRRLFRVLEPIMAREKS